MATALVSQLEETLAPLNVGSSNYVWENILEKYATFVKIIFFFNV
jgi:hypothetical protein